MKMHRLVVPTALVMACGTPAPATAPAMRVDAGDITPASVATSSRSANPSPQAPSGKRGAATEAVAFCGLVLKPDAGKVDCADPTVVDLTPLAGLDELAKLWLRNTQVSDLAPVARHASEEPGAVGGDKDAQDVVPSSQVAALKAALPKLVVSR